MNAPAQPDGPPIRDGKSYSALVHLAEDVAAFVAIDGELRHQGFSAPQIHAADLDNGFIVLEDLGSETLLDAAGKPIPERYVARLESADKPEDEGVRITRELISSLKEFANGIHIMAPGKEELVPQLLQN